MSHPMRQYHAATTQQQSIWSSTVRGLGFGKLERQSLLDSNYEPGQLTESIPSYNEIMLKHRTERIPIMRDGATITEVDVKESVSTIQRAIMYIEECKALAKEYEWETLSTKLKEPILHSELETACYTLKGADMYLSGEAREVVGFDWASCAWRHCGAFADAQEAIDELDHLIGILEPFEGLFILDIVERSFRDILAVMPQHYTDATILMTEYKPLQRMVSLLFYLFRHRNIYATLVTISFPANNPGKTQSDSDGMEGEGTLDEEYLAALEFLRETEKE